MRGMAFEVAAAFPPSLLEPNNNNNNKLKEGSFGSNNNEPISVLDTRRSPSPSTSTSTLSSSFNGGATTTANTTPSLGGTDNPQKWPDSVPQDMGISGYVSNFLANVDNGRKDDWPELQPIPAEFELQQQRFGVGLEDWENLLSESNGTQDQSLRWISGDLDDTNLSLQQLLQSNQIEHNGQIQETTFVSHFSPQNANFLPFCNPDQNPQLVLNQTQFHQHPGFQKVPVFRQNVEKTAVCDVGFVKDSVSNLGFQKGLISNPGHELLNKKPLLVAKQEPPHSAVSPVNNNNHHHHHQYQVICDQLFAAAELMLSGNFSHAQGILARLNHQFASASAPNKPFQRAAFYFKEALQLQLQSNLNPNKNVQPFNGMFKMGAYKMFSEVSPIIQFMNFTSNQTILEAIGDAKNIHIIDFDIGFGAQWSSFIQELPTKNNGGCSLKITAFASPSTHHPIELALMHENLSQFAQEIGISFELEVVNFDSFDPRSFLVSGNETIAVNFPIWSAFTHLAAIPSILHFIKQLSPAIVVSLDRGCERTDLPFPHYLLQGLQYFEVLLDSIDGSHVVSDVSNKIERFLFQPHIEHMVLGKLQSPEPMPHWKSLYTAGGYSPVLFSNFAETQADCVVKRMQVHGFHIEKRQAALVLCWQNRELMTASAWKC
uniref:scarecrow-like protein 27 n=1 Tax=Erigeron canadensis TaxID=72917 RepID=UPI001CB92F2F|nr:scarecrow-like protein 27 [Erigeron canadensis]XP_043611584.1 scarecrow-like protein 27 [Erigeron canadensis]